MGSRCDRKRENVEGDRLSSLPDDLIHKILSFIDIKHAIETSALSSRWRYIWTSMPVLNFSNEGFHTHAKFSKFVKHLMSGRNNQIEVSSVKLTFYGKGRLVSQAFVKRVLNVILNHESSHNVQQLNISCSIGKWMKSPLPLSSSPALKHLTLTGCTYEHPITTTPTWELLTLTTLNLHHVTLDYGNVADKCSDLFSNFANLKNLTLKRCGVSGHNCFTICHPRLSNLTLEDGHHDGNVVTPQLKNLTIRRWRLIHLISAPNLSSLHYNDWYSPFQLSADLVHLEKVDICIYNPSKDRENAHKIVCVLQQLHSVKFLTLNLEIVKLLSSFYELISPQPSPFANLKSLKIYPVDVTEEEQTQPKITKFTKVKNYLLDGSPGATFTMVSHDEIRAVENVTSARKLMRELQILLNQWKENSETNMTKMKQDKGSMESHMATVPEQVEAENPLDTEIKWHFESLTYINDQLKKRCKNSGRVISMLRKIEGVMTKLPTSHRAKLQISFSCLCAEAETIMADQLKNPCDKKPRLYIHELSTSSQPSA